MASRRTNIVYSDKELNADLTRKHIKLKADLAVAKTAITEKVQEFVEVRSELTKERKKSANLSQALTLVQAHCTSFINDFHGNIKQFLDNADLDGTLPLPSAPEEPAVHQPAQEMSADEIRKNLQPVDDQSAKTRKVKPGKAAGQQETSAAAISGRPKRKSVGAVNYAAPDSRRSLRTTK